MKKYQVYAIGNAMVDYEIKVEDDFFDENQVEKGLMTLVDEDRQKTLIAAVEGHIVKKQGGGSAANSMTAFSQLGGKGFYSCKVADDMDGSFFLNDLVRHGLDTNLDKLQLKSGTTGKCLVMITPDAERTMNTFLGITSDFSTKELVSSALIDSEYLYIEGALIASPTGREAMFEAKRIAEKEGVKVSLTLWDPSMVKYFRKEMHELVGEGIELLFCNEEEACLFTGMDDLDRAMEELKKYARTFAVTCGKKGSVLYDGKEMISINPVAVQAIDTTGAGDIFAGSFLYGITNGLTWAQAGALASRVSSRVVGQYGPRLSSAELEQMKEG